MFALFTAKPFGRVRNVVRVRAARVDLAEAEVDAAIRLVQAPDLHVEEPEGQERCACIQAALRPC